MLYSEEVQGRFPAEGSAWIVYYVTPESQGYQRFGSRSEATAFAVEKLQELLPTLETVE